MTIDKNRKVYIVEFENNNITISLNPDETIKRLNKPVKKVHDMNTWSKEEAYNKWVFMNTKIEEFSNDQFLLNRPTYKIQ